MSTGGTIVVNGVPIPLPIQGAISAHNSGEETCGKKSMLNPNAVAFSSPRTPCTTEINVSDAKLLLLPPLPPCPSAIPLPVLEAVSPMGKALNKEAKNFTPLYTQPTTDIGDSIKLLQRKSIALQIGAIAQENKGVIYGGFVRDCIVLSENFTDIDIWFSKMAQAQAFIAALRERYSIKAYKVKSKGGDYSFTMQDVRVFHPKGIIDIDCVISQIFPVNDFTCNLLTYDVVKKEMGIGDDKYTKEWVLEFLSKRKTHIFPSYAQRIKNNSFAHRRYLKRCGQLTVLPLG